ncbi:MAG: PD-(D/E)XK nuclease family protein [Planctomycetes bacterium]|nr:PD-(D/E)XK nuclease family protein [Planctomycetota bacterium]
MGEIRCELSWSPSRAKTFESCRRQYFYQYYGSWRGWEAKASEAARQLYRLKQMKSLDVFAGIVVHDLIAAWFGARKSGRELAPEAVLAQAKQRFDQAWRESRGEGWKRDPKRVSRFVEHHYGESVAPARAGAIWAKVERSLRTFFTLEALEPVRRSEPKSWLAVEALDTFEIARTKVYAVPDFAFRCDDRVWILDWKTGKEREADQKQLQCYALYARARWKTPVQALRLTLVYLPSAELREVAVDERELAQVEGDIAHGIELLAERHFDPDREPADLAHFPPNGAPRACRYCVFREACDAAPRESASSLGEEDPTAE